MAEGRPKEDLKNMANAAGQACRDYTPPGGETLDQVGLPSSVLESDVLGSVWFIHCVCIQVKMRFKTFLRSLYQRMLDEHAPPDPCSASSEPSEPVRPVIAGLANDGVRGVPVHALIVSHGAFIRVCVRHLVDDLQCCLPAGLKMNQVFSPCPNTGISRFIFTLRRTESVPQATHIHCVFINRKDHLDDV